MKKLTAIISIFVMVLALQSLAFAGAKCNFTPKNKHNAEAAAPKAQEPAANPVTTVTAPVTEAIAPVAEATAKVVQSTAEAVTAPIAAPQASPSPATS